MTERETRKHIEEMRADGCTENEVLEFLEDLKAKKEALNKFIENDEKNLELSIFDMDLRPVTDGVYEVKSCTFSGRKDAEGKESIVCTFTIYDYENDRMVEQTTRWTASFASSLFQTFRNYFGEYANVKSLKEYLKLAKDKTWFIQKRTNGIYENWIPCSYSPQVDPESIGRSNVTWEI